MQVSDNLSLSKTIKEYVKDVQKTDNDKNLLYLKNNYNIIKHEDITGYEETTKVTEFPAMDIIHKVDSQNNRLYLETIYSDSGEIIDTIETTNAYSDDGIRNEPIMIEIQRKSPYGKPLYLQPIINKWDEKIVISTEETTNPINVITWKIDSNTGNEIPDETEENEPIFIPFYRDVNVNILSNPDEFTIIELLEVIYSEKMEKYNYSNIIADMFINEDDIDFTYEEHSANTGAFVLTLLPHGKVKLKTIELVSPASIFELMENNFHKDIDIYINDVKFVDGMVKLRSKVSTCDIRFENNSNKLLDINSYAIMY